VDADLVVEAGGRHSAIRRLLAETGVTLREEKHDTDMAYLSRFFRLRPGAVEPDKQAFNGGTTGYLGYGVFRGDNRTFSVTIAVGTEDTELRDLIDASRFDIAARLLPASRPWIDPAISEPIAPMHVMAGTINRVRDLVVDGRPIVLGFVAVGDALICTNPLYGRGCSLAGVHARLLAHALREHGDDAEALALRIHDEARREIVPWYGTSVAQDDAARQARNAVAPDNLAGAASILTEGLIPLTRVDAMVGRAFFRMVNLLSPPDALFTDPEVMRRVLAYWQARDTRPPEPLLGPPREEMVAALVAAGEVAAG
jgi:2-polyprenyl-6-methoxyphenol hydroxylase-like FAD-dependent oxidoreductase